MGTGGRLRKGVTYTAGLVADDPGAKYAVESVEIWVRRCAARMDEAGLFFGHGTDNAWDEAAWLVLHVLGAPLDGGFTDWDRPVTTEEAARIAALLAERIGERRPLAYLLGEAWFCGLRFVAGPAALVPRSPLAALIADGFRPWVSAAPRRVLDLCTGGGCLAVAIAKHMAPEQVDAVDLSEEALALARENVTLHGVQDRVRLLRSDLFAALDGARYDLVVTNPPYVPAGRLRALPAEYAAEPSLGLVSGEDGLVLPLRILHDAPVHLVPGGVLVCEVGESENALQAALPRVPLTWIEFEQGGGGVFTIGRQQLEAARSDVAAALEQRGHVV